MYIYKTKNEIKNIYIYSIKQKTYRTKYPSFILTELQNNIFVFNVSKINLVRFYVVVVVI